MELMIAGVDALLLSVFAVFVVWVVKALVCELVDRLNMYAWRLRGSGGMTAIPHRGSCGNELLGVSRVKAASQLTLAEQLYLLAYDEGTCLSGPDGMLLGDCLAGALLVELFERELIYERPDGIVAVVERPGELPSLLEDAMTAIRATEQSTERWANRLGSKLRPIKKTVARSLVKRGVLAEERGKVLGLIPRTRFPTIDPAPRSELLKRLHAVLLSTPRPDPTGPGMIQTRPRDPSEDEARLIALLELRDIIWALVPPDRRKEARRRAEQLPDGLSAAQRRVYWAVVPDTSAG